MPPGQGFAEPPPGGPTQGPPNADTEAKPPPPPPPEPTPPPAAGKCKADANHCCLADGRLVVPGGCQPSYPSGVRPATNRGSDGNCLPIECHLKCLPADAAIATPFGPRPVSALRVGHIVWTATVDGRRIAASLVEVNSRPVRDQHSVIEVTLADGRVFRASPEHPLAMDRAAGKAADASDPLRAVGSLQIGAPVDGSFVTALRALPYTGATWDILPAGATGTYWSDGVRIGSTLR
jgi:hypothetical protein